MKIGLVTVLYKSESVLEGFFESLLVQSFRNYHLYIIDNDPNDQTSKIINAYLAKTGHNYTHIKNSENLGVAKANNQGIILSRQSGFSHTLLLNNDILFKDPKTLEAMIGVSIDQDEAIVVPKILYAKSLKVWMAGGKILRWKGIVIHTGQDKKDQPRYNKPGYTEYAPTCFMLINNRLFDQIGIMDEKYFVYYDDVDFIHRALEAGYKTYYLPSVTILHYVSQSTGGVESLFNIYYVNRNRIYYIRKNLRGVLRLIAITYSYSRFIKFFFKRPKMLSHLWKAVQDGKKMSMS